MPDKTTWLGSCTCDICHKQIQDTLYDAKTIHGPWATMCQDCYTTNNIGRLGLGLGQRYQKQDNIFVKVEG